MRKLMLLTMLAIGGCAEMRKQDAIDAFNRTIGIPKDALITALGVPTNQTVLSDGTEVLEYLRQSQGFIPTLAFPIRTVSGPMYMGGQGVSGWCKITFILTGAKISSWKFEGNSCY